MNSETIEELEGKIGYTFRDRSLLVLALTHTSFANEAHSGHLGSNERLEFLGDAVLELVSSDFFYREKPKLSEGERTKLRALSVSRHSPIARSRFRFRPICCSEEARR